jgi:hypothetical protein
MVLRKFSILIFCLLVSGSTQLFGTGEDAGSKKLLKLLSKELDAGRSELSLQKVENHCFDANVVEDVSAVYQDGKEIGFVISAIGKGRHDRFNYLIFFNEDREVELVRVVSYYSDHGGEITSKRWLAQFVGYGGGDLDYGDEVQAISGATLSAGSIANGIHDITIHLQDCEL